MATLLEKRGRWCIEFARSAVTIWQAGVLQRAFSSGLGDPGSKTLYTVTDPVGASGVLEA